MKAGFDLHKVKQVRKWLLNKMDNDREISQRNKEFILKYDMNRQSKDLGPSGNVRSMNILIQFAKLLKVDFDIATKEDIINAIALLKEKGYSPYTLSTRKAQVKTFYKWLKGVDDEYPPEVKWIKSNINKNDRIHISANQLITEDDIKKVIPFCNHPRDKAFLSVLFETGARIGEISSLQMMNIKFDDKGGILSVEGKTGKRDVRIISSVPYLSTWLENHPYKNIPEAPVWTPNRYSTGPKVMSYDAFSKTISRAFKRAGIDKRCNPHYFRHSRASYLANRLNEFQMDQYLGWVQGSNMPSTYIHMSSSQLDNSLLELNGIKMDKNSKESILKPIKCPRCDTINSFDSKLCMKCGGALDIVTAIEYEDKLKKERETREKYDKMMNKLMEDPEILEVFKKKLSAINIE